jgi:hypothetical protein
LIGRAVTREPTEVAAGGGYLVLRRRGAAIGTWQAIDAVTAVAAVTEQQTAIAAIATSLTEVDSAPAIATVSEQQTRVTTVSAVGAIAAVAKENASVAAVASVSASGAICRCVGTVAEQPQDRATACRGCKQRCRGGRRGAVADEAFRIEFATHRSGEDTAGIRRQRRGRLGCCCGR